MTTALYGRRCLCLAAGLSAEIAVRSSAMALMTGIHARMNSASARGKETAAPRTSTAPLTVAMMMTMDMRVIQTRGCLPWPFRAARLEQRFGGSLLVRRIN
jgi:hypothetical protein